MGSKYPWPEIRARYETGNYTMKDLSEIYGFNENYGHRKAGRDGWEKGKSKEKVRKAAAKKVIEKEADKEANLRGEYEKIINNIRRGAVNILFSDRPNFDRLKQFKITSEIIANCRREQWEVNGIKETAKKVEQELTGLRGGPIELSGLSDKELDDQILKLSRLIDGS